MPSLFTTPAFVTRTAKDTWVFFAEAGDLARLYDGNPCCGIHLGLYSMPFCLVVNRLK